MENTQRPAQFAKSVLPIFRRVERDFRIPARTQRHWCTHNPAFRATALKLGGKRVMYDRRALEQWFETQRESVHK